MALLAVDLGGTKILFQLSLQQGEVLLESELASEDFDSFSDVLQCFLQHDAAQNVQIQAACIAVAGPVNGTQASVTNLPWQIDAVELEKTFSITKVHLCNDFEAVGYGIDQLEADELITLQQAGSAESANVRAVIGAGTGLGQAILTKTAEHWQVMPTEGGHVDFAPTSARQIVLLEHLMERFGHVSYERLLSGSGLVIIYEFLRSYLQKSESAELREAMINGDAAAAISDFANQ
jgi:glucokinase